MKKSKILLAVFSAFLVLGFTACDALFGNNNNGASGGGSGESGNTNVDDEIKGPLTAEKTWEGKNSEGESITYYINSNYVIKDGGKLIIEDGAIVKFGPSGKITVNNTGAITATGTKFTSYRDTEGRAISISGGVEPAPGDWKQVYIYGGVGTFTSCKFYYGGNNCSTLDVAKGSGSAGKAKVDGCEFCYNAGTEATKASVYAALCFSKDTVYNDDNTCVKNCVFKNNVWPLSVPFFFSLDGSNQFGINTEKNEYNYIHIIDADITKEVVWAKQSVPFLYAASGSGTGVLAIQDGGKLTIKGSDDAENPALICFAQRGIEVAKGGKLSLEGNIKFTNSPVSSATTFDGIYCARKIQYKDVGIATVKKVLLTSNPPFVIENYIPTQDTYKEEYKFAEHYRRAIQAVNEYVDETVTD